MQDEITTNLKETEQEEIPVTDSDIDLEGSELESFESDTIEELEFIEDSRLDSIVESLLFASDKPLSLARMKEIFDGTQVTLQKIKMALDRLAIQLASPDRGVTLEEVSGGYQLRTKIENQKFLHRSQKNRPFKLSGPALEVLSIVAYKQPVVKAEIDQIRGVESGHLLRALMEKGLVSFGEKSDLPGRPMYYQTTRKFLEVFSLRNIKELPTLSQIDELLPEGIDEVEADRKQGLGQITENMGQSLTQSYSEGEEELQSITQDLETISTSSEFFEQEKKREREAKDAEKAQSLREALLVGETLSNRDLNWLKRYEEQMAQAQSSAELTQNQNAATDQVEASYQNDPSELQNQNELRDILEKLESVTQSEDLDPLANQKQSESWTEA
jgi:segregation and condensation protein B